MNIIYLQAIGCIVFVISVIVSRIRLKNHPSNSLAKKTTKLIHFLLIFIVMLPVLIGFFYPGLSRYDEILGLPSLPFRPITLTVGVIIMIIGLFLSQVSVRVLKKKGAGRPAFDLSETVVEENLYKYSRNPMSLGFYLMCIALGLLANSTFFTLWSLIIIIPIHIFFLKFFEERELELRFGQPYLEYKKRVPFLIPSYRFFNRT